MSESKHLVKGFMRQKYRNGNKFTVFRWAWCQQRNAYGTQYKILLEYENIKFVTNAGKNYEALMETMTNGRTYVQIGGEEILRIVQMDENNRRNRVIEFDKKNKQWHVHQGYLHSENSENQHDPLSISDVRLLEKVKKIWHNHREQI